MKSFPRFPRPCIGKARADKYGAEILATTHAFLTSVGQLDKFPDNLLPTILVSPLWQAPLSEEAEGLRAV
jgi:hypothetical protein